VLFFNGVLVVFGAALAMTIGKVVTVLAVVVETVEATVVREEENFVGTINPITDDDDDPGNSTTIIVINSISSIITDGDDEQQQEQHRRFGLLMILLLLLLCRLLILIPVLILDFVFFIFRFPLINWE
jgi:hypothetical protein